MPFSFIIGLIIFIFLAVLIIVLVKKTVKILFYIFLLFFVVSSAFIFLIYQDFSDFRKEYTNSDKLFLLTDGDEIITGIIIVGAEPVFLNENQILGYSSYLKNLDYDSLLANNFKFMLVKLEILDELDDEFEILGQTISREKLLSIFRSDQPLQDLTGNSGRVTINGLEIDGSDKIEFKGFLFMTILANDIIQTQQPFKMLLYYKDNYLFIYPETILFKSLKKIPEGFINQITTQVIIKVEKLKEKV